MKKTISIIGDVFGQTGYAQHTKQFSKALKKRYDKVYVDTNAPAGWEVGCPDWLFKSIKDKPEKCDVGIFIGLPQFAPLIWHDYDEFIQFVVWEGDKVPKFWFNYLIDEHIKQIWVPSTHVKDAILNTMKELTDIEIDGYDININDWNKIRIVPEGVDTELFKKRSIDSKDNKMFTFIANKGWRNGINDRGGIQYCIKAFVEEFKESEPVKMIIKINGVYNDAGWNLDDELRKIGVTEKHKNLFFNIDILNDDKLSAFYNLGDCFVAPSMAEGFGLTIAEAMASELPIITTPFGGQTDFVGLTNLFLKGSLVSAVDGIRYEEISWYKPDLEDLKCSMRRVYNNKVEFKKIGVNNREVIKSFSWDNAAKIALDFLK